MTQRGSMPSVTFVDPAGVEVECRRTKLVLPAVPPMEVGHKKLRAMRATVASEQGKLDPTSRESELCQVGA